MILKIKNLVEEYADIFPHRTLDILPLISSKNDKILLKYRSNYTMSNFLICCGNYRDKHGKVLDLKYTDITEAMRMKAEDFYIWGYLEEQGFSEFEMKLSDFFSYKPESFYNLDSKIWVVRDSNFSPMTLEEYKYTKRLF
jgi:hypothetical protein